MTSLLRKKLRTIASRTTRLRTAAKFALLGVLAGGTAIAQQPGSFPTWQPPGGAKTAPWPDLPAAYQPGGAVGGAKTAEKPTVRPANTPAPAANRPGDRNIPPG